MISGESTLRHAEDAFGLTADPAAYVPRLGLEFALAEFVELIGKTPACAALTGEAGLGKTLLLQVLRERLEGSFEALYVPFPHLAAVEVWRWVAVALGLGSGEDDRGAVLGRAQSLAADGSGLVLLVDDAGALPPSTREALFAACTTSGFSLVLAFDSEDSQLAALPDHVRRIDLGPPLTLAETRTYVHARLRRVDPEGGIAARLGAARLAEIHIASGGIPARLHALLDAWLRGEGTEIAGTPGAPVASAAEPRQSPAPAEPQTTAAAVERAALPPLLRVLFARLDEPRAQLALAALCVIAIAGFWYFALQRSSGVESVGVPVQRFEPPRREPAPKPPPAELAPVAPFAPAPSTEPAAPAPEASAGNPAAAIEPVEAPAHAAPTTLRAPPLAAPRPAADPARLEPPVKITSPKFPDEHVPPSLEATPLGPPPAGPRLSVNAAPWAEIQLDGELVGETPIGELAVSPGTHLVSARLPDGRVLERHIEARAGDVYVVFP